MLFARHRIKNLTTYMYPITTQWRQCTTVSLFTLQASKRASLRQRARSLARPLLQSNFYDLVSCDGVLVQFRGLRRRYCCRVSRNAMRGTAGMGTPAQRISVQRIKGALVLACVVLFTWAFTLRKGGYGDLLHRRP
jgi:hypothetical protein